MERRVLSVGSCGVDSSRLARVVAAEIGARMDSAYTAEEALNRLADHDYALVLVNRVIDGDGSLGVDFIADARRGNKKTPLMLVSDYADAQAAAIANGALQGFGKSELFSEETARLLKGAVGET